MKPALQIDEDLEFERAEWRVERVATWAIAGLMLAAGLGLFGRGGPLATGVAGDRDSALWVEYDRFQRYGASAPLLVHADPGLADRGELSVALNREYLSAVEVTAITPDPTRTEVGAYSIVYRFATGPSVGPLLIQFWMQPTERGVLTGRVAVDTMRRDFKSFVYP